MDPAEEIKQLQQQLEELRLEKGKQEREFGEGRAKLKQLYMQKEEEIRLLGIELEEANSRVVIAECTAENRVEAEQRKCREELATVHQLSREEVFTAVNEEREKLAAEIHNLQKFTHKLEQDKKRYKALYLQNKDREAPPVSAVSPPTTSSILSPSVLSGFTKSIAKRVSGVSIVGNLTSTASTQQQPTQQQQLVSPSHQAPNAPEQHTPMAGLVNPAFNESLSESQCSSDVTQTTTMLSIEAGEYEEQIAGLLEEVRILRERLMQYQQQPEVANASVVDEQSSLAAEKSSRQDLELYTSILNAKNNALNTQLAGMRADADKWRKLYDSERSSMVELRATWQKANDHFLSSQRHSLTLTQRLKDLLTEEQLGQLRKMSDKDSDDGDLDDGDGIWSDNEEDFLGKSPPTVPSQSSISPTASTVTGVKEESSDALEELANTSSQSGGLSSRYSPEKLPKLTEDQRKSLLTKDSGLEEITSDEEARLGGAFSPTNVVGGGRTVSETSWRKMQRDLRSAKSRLAKPCLNCRKLNEKISDLKIEMEGVKVTNSTLEEGIERQLKEMDREYEYRKQSEEKWSTQVEEYQQKEILWGIKLDEATKQHDSLIGKWKDAAAAIHKNLSVLTSERTSLHQHIKKLTEENDRLAGKYLKSARQLQEQEIELPSNVEDMQMKLLQLQEEVITSLVGKESLEENLTANLSQLKRQLVEEETRRRSLEDELGRENRELKDMVHRLQTAAAVGHKSEETQQQEHQMMAALKIQLAETVKVKKDLESEVSEQKGRVASLQRDLDLSEETQRDFVRLSQNLQVQLEKIRQSDSEVRWQHEDDVSDCNNCKNKFSTSRRKHHCRHCGKVFCTECVSKTVTAGPNNRACRVCDVCHTLLVPHAQPYFSSAAHTQSLI